MKKNIYTIFDASANAYLQPFFLDTDLVAKRAIFDCLRDPEHNFSLHPGDYTLFNIGTFDNLTGTIVYNVPATLGCFIEYQSPQLVKNLTGDPQP